MEYDQVNYQIQDWKNPRSLYWILNPVVAIRELVFGQRVPKIMLIERHSSESFQERTKIPCPHCGTLHSGLKWSLNNNASKNWFGLFCDHCGRTIPCLTNLTSYLFLVLTFPIWVWFIDQWKAKWLQQQPARYENLDLHTIPNPYAGMGWIRVGLQWGFFMFLFMSMLHRMIDRPAFQLRQLAVDAVVWTVAGLLFGLFMKWQYDKGDNETLRT